jgi:Tfp pilus assembly PilM family ATPase
VSPDGAPRERVVIVAARRPMISRFVEAVRRAGLKPTGVDLDAFALVRVSARWEGDGTDVYALAEELRISMDYYGSQPDSEPISEVLVSGSGAEDEDTVRALDEQLPVPVSTALPLGSLAGAEFPAGENPYRHTVSVGLAMGRAA